MLINQLRITAWIVAASSITCLIGPAGSALAQPWTQASELLADNGSESGRFGESVAIENGRATAGAADQ